MIVTVKLVTRGRSQAVRIPKGLQFHDVDRVTLRREGDALILTPVRKDWPSFADEPSADEDFMAERPPLFDAHRVEF